MAVAAVGWQPRRAAAHPPGRRARNAARAPRPPAC